MRNVTKLRVAVALTFVAPVSVRAGTAADPQVLTSGVAVGPISGAAGSLLYYKLSVPSGATNATFAISGSSGDCDLYVRFGVVPTRSVWDYRPYLGTSRETVSIVNPAAGDWFVMLRGYSAYVNVMLTSAQDGRGDLVAATPTLSVAPGTYSGQVSVALSTTTPNAVIRYTTDGAAPTDTSENYTAPIIVSATTTIQATTFATGHTRSGVVIGTYVIQSAIVELASDVSVPRLSGALRSEANFRFAVPFGQARLTFTITGSSGDCDLYVKYGRLATTSVWDQRPYTSTSNETVVINSPAAGDYYVMLNGYSAYSGVTLTAQFSGGVITSDFPDLTVYAGAFSPRITTETFSSTACEVQEGVLSAGTHRLLRFTLETRNVGTRDLVLGDPATNPRYSWASCHGHYHLLGFAQYRLLSPAGQVVRSGQKIGFCLEDLARWDPAANPSARYTCNYQGIQAGWSDVYNSSLSGQWINITGLASGRYILEATVDPTNLIAESDDTNNTARLSVTIP